MFADVLASLIQQGVPMQSAIERAARDCGLAGQVTIRHLQDAVTKHPNAFPPGYLRLRPGNRT